MKKLLISTSQTHLPSLKGVKRKYPILLRVHGILERIQEKSNTHCEVGGLKGHSTLIVLCPNAAEAAELRYYHHELLTKLGSEAGITRIIYSSIPSSR